MAFPGNTSTGQGEVVVRASQVCKRFPGGILALDQVSLEVRRGEVLVIIGPSGSGKSTLLRCLNGLEGIDGGSVLINGITLDGSEATRLAVCREVGMVFQSFNLFPHLSVQDNINLAQRLVQKKDRDQATALTRDLLRKVGVLDKAERYPDELSGGQQQRVAIARALALRPKIMLFDEATSALDPEMIGEVLDVMRGLAAEGMTMLVVTHEMGFAREVSDRVLFMEHGQVVEEAPSDRFFTQAHQKRTREFLNQIL